MNTVAAEGKSATTRLRAAIAAHGDTVAAGTIRNVIVVGDIIGSRFRKIQTPCRIEVTNGNMGAGNVDTTECHLACPVDITGGVGLERDIGGVAAAEGNGTVTPGGHADGGTAGRGRYGGLRGADA